MTLAQIFLRYVGRNLVRLRYRVRIEGLDEFRRLRGPALITPNHPGYIDPVLVMTQLGGEQALRPLVISFMYRPIFLRPLMKFINALEVPELEQHSAQARAATQELIGNVIAGLDRGGKFLIYPAGRIEFDGREQIGSTMAVPEILRQRPDTALVLVRTVGVWGSMSTRAVNGQMPDIGVNFLKAVGVVLCNLIFFAPRREIRMTIKIVRPRELPSLDRAWLNPFLEEWYNRELNPEPKFVPYHFLFGPRHFDYPKVATAPTLDAAEVTSEVRAAVGEIVAGKLKRPLTPEEDAPGTLLDGLGLDSLDRMEIAQGVEERFGFQSDAVATRLGELWALAQGAARREKRVVQVPARWLLPRDEIPFALEGATILEAVVRRGLAQRSDAAAADDLSGVVTCERLLIGAQLLARRFAELPGEAVGLMLPASVAADTALLALQWAGKLPVLLNWTTGPVNLNHAVRTMGLQRVVTSRKFIDRVGVKLEGADFVFLEDTRQGIGKIEMLTTLLRTRFRGGAVLASVPRPAADAPAVVLFTSGSEKAPKAVPLTHRNILSDVVAGAAALGLRRDDILLGFLPPFHSFGLSANIVLPLAGGLRVVHHADPTDAAALARKIAAYRPTLLLTTPTFFGYILSAATPGELDSLRLVITGAEKCPEALFEQAHRVVPHAILAEGYGITECSPVVSVNRPNDVRHGTIGRPLDGVEVRVVDPESYAPLPSDERGLLLVHGPTVFPGYLHHDGPTPFHEIDGQRWYITGDLARVDGDGFIHFAGRLKRFLKAGGEMISLPALEEPLARVYPPGEQGPRIAVEGIELPKGRRIVAFTTTDLTLAPANALLAEAGFRGIMRLDEVRRIDALPLLGTGKIDYKVLRAQIETGA